MNREFPHGNISANSIHRQVRFAEMGGSRHDTGFIAGSRGCGIPERDDGGPN